MDILKSFEVFLSEPLSLLKDSIVQIVGLTTGNGMKPEVNAELLNQKAQITVINSEKMYKLLKRASLRKNNPILAKEKPLFGQLTLKV